MKWFFTICINWLIISTFTLHAQEKELVVDPDLAQKGEKYQVKYKAYRVGKVPKYRFGPFKVVSGKTGWIQTSRLSRIWSREVKLLTENKAHFSLVNNQGDTASVNTFFYITTHYEESIPIFSTEYLNIEIGDEFYEEEALFTASIMLNSDKSEWLLQVNAVENESNYVETRSMLTNGERKIILKHIHTDFKKGLFSAPALSYEFWEVGEALGAVKYFPGRIGYYAVWLKKEMQEVDKILLAAAATAILYLKSMN